MSFSYVFHPQQLFFERQLEKHKASLRLDPIPPDVLFEIYRIPEGYSRLTYGSEKRKSKKTKEVESTNLSDFLSCLNGKCFRFSQIYHERYYKDLCALFDEIREKNPFDTFRVGAVYSIGSFSTGTHLFGLDDSDLDLAVTLDLSQLVGEDMSDKDKFDVLKGCVEEVRGKISHNFDECEVYTKYMRERKVRQKHFIFLSCKSEGMKMDIIFKDHYSADETIESMWYYSRFKKNRLFTNTVRILKLFSKRYVKDVVKYPTSFVYMVMVVQRMVNDLVLYKRDVLVDVDNGGCMLREKKLRKLIKKAGYNEMVCLIACCNQIIALDSCNKGLVYDYQTKMYNYWKFRSRSYLVRYKSIFKKFLEIIQSGEKNLSVFLHRLMRGDEMSLKDVIEKIANNEFI